MVDRPILELLQPAIGFFQLGMYEDANEELQSLPPEAQADSNVLQLRLEIHQSLEEWSSARVLAESLATKFPENPSWWLAWTYALRREVSVEAAHEILRNALRLHPSDGLITYNLACYTCVMGDLTEAQVLLDKAIALDDSFKVMATGDPDLEPLWESLGND